MAFGKNIVRNPMDKDVSNFVKGPFVHAYYIFRSTDPRNPPSTISKLKSLST
jgi:hypothetical protein